MIITKKCIFDVLSTIATSPDFDITLCGDKTQCLFPSNNINILCKALNQYSEETIYFCCYILYKEDYIQASINDKHHCFELYSVYCLTLKGFELLDKLKNEL